MEYKYLIMCLIFACPFFSCTKVENNTLIPESLPYGLEFNDKAFNPNYSRNYTYCYFDSVSNTDVIFRLEEYKKDSLVEAIGLKGIGIINNTTKKLIAQFNFQKFYDQNLIDVYLFPMACNLNRSNLKSNFATFIYKDSIKLLTINDASIDVLYKTGNENNHYLKFITHWQPDAKHSYMIFRKSNRIKGNNYPDTLISFDLNMLKTSFKIPIGAYIRPLEVAFQYSKNLILWGWSCGNGIRFESMNDSSCYIMAIDSKGIIIKTDTLNAGINQYKYGAVFNNNSSTIFATKLLSSDNGKERKYLNSYDMNFGITHQVEFQKDIIYCIYPELYDKNSCFIALENSNKISLLDSNLKIIKEQRYHFQINSISRKFMGDIETPACNHFIYGGQYYDINDDGYLDFLIQSSENQIIVIDGFSLEPLLSSISKDQIKGYCFIRDNGKNKILIGNNHELIIYDINTNDLLTRVAAYQSEIINFSIFIFLIPIVYISVFKIKYYRNILKSINSDSNSQSVIVFNHKKSVKSINNMAEKFFQFKAKPREISDFPQFIEELFESTMEKSKFHNNHLEYRDNVILINTYKFRIFRRFCYCIISFTDVSEILWARKRKNELKTAIGVAHSLKTPLSTILMRFELIQKMILKEINDPLITDSRRIILRNLKYTRDMVRQISFMAKDKQTASFRNYSLKKYIEKWLSENSERYEEYNIKFENKIISDAEIQIDSKSFSLLLLTICDNSMQSMNHLSVEKLISFDQEENNGELILLISDNGTGMDADTLLQVKQNIGFSSKATGSGLGIQLINKVCKEHQFKLDILSEKDIGTQLKIIIKNTENKK